MANKLGGIELEGLFGGIELINKPADKLPQDLASAFGNINAGLLGATYTPIWYVGTQVVNGINHILVCKEIRSTKDKDTCIVVLVINIPPNSIGGKGAKLVQIIEEADLPQDVYANFKKATQMLLGVSYKPVAYVGKQVVRGMNYFIICDACPIYPGAQSHAVLFVFNVFENEVSVVSVTPIPDSQPEEQEMLCGYAFTW